MNGDVVTDSAAPARYSRGFDSQEIPGAHLGNFTRPKKWAVRCLVLRDSIFFFPRWINLRYACICIAGSEMRDPSRGLGRKARARSVPTFPTSKKTFQGEKLGRTAAVSSGSFVILKSPGLLREKIREWSCRKSDELKRSSEEENLSTAR